MKAAVLRGGQIVVDEVDEPVPGPGEVLVAVRACGICGSDLHFVHHGARFVQLSSEMRGVPTRPAVDLGRDVRMGHEFCGEVLEAGPDTDAPPPGTLVTSIPALQRGAERTSLSFTNDEAAGYGERMVLSASLLLEVPAGIDPAIAAMTEPLAVGLHAVNRSGIQAGDAAVVLGCGPVGLSIIAGLRRGGIEPIVATDYSPARRATALAMGAHEAVDPTTEDGVAAWRRLDGRRPLVVFEAVGVPGMIDGAMREAPRNTRIVVPGLCMETDVIQPVIGILKELTIQFVVAYDGDEFAGALDSIATGEIDVSPMITGRVGLDDIAQAFDDLARPDRHTKVVVEPHA